MFGDGSRSEFCSRVRLPRSYIERRPPPVTGSLPQGIPKGIARLAAKRRLD